MAIKIGLALGGGGVRGLAHLPLLRLLDELELPPSQIVGTSMGAIIGALYASGLSAAEIEDRIRRHIVLKDDQLKDILKKSKNLTRWTKVFSPNFRSGGLIKADGLFEVLFTELDGLEFKDLKIPFRALACDYLTGEEVILDKGPVLPAVQASMAVPGVFAPIEQGGRLLIDGGVVNNLGYELAASDADISIAIDVTNLPPNESSLIPSALEIAVGALDIMQLAALNKRLETSQPDILIRPEIDSVDMFDFHKMEYILDAGQKARTQLENELLKLKS